MVKLRALLLLATFSFALLTSLPQAQATTILTFYTDCDAYINGGDAVKNVTNYGGATTLNSGSLLSWTNLFNSMVKFNISSGGDSTLIVNATFKVFALGSLGTGNTSLYTVTDDSWNETDVTWANAPPGVQWLQNRTFLQWHDFSCANLTTFVKNQAAGDKIVSFRLYGETVGDNFEQFSSREGDATPMLIIEYMEAPTTSFVVWLATGIAMGTLVLGPLFIFKKRNREEE